MASLFCAASCHVHQTDGYQQWLISQHRTTAVPDHDTTTTQAIYALQIARPPYHYKQHGKHVQHELHTTFAVNLQSVAFVECLQIGITLDMGLTASQFG